MSLVNQEKKKNNFRWNVLFIENAKHHYYQFLLQNTQKKYHFCYLNMACINWEVVQMLIHSLSAASWIIIIMFYSYLELLVIDCVFLYEIQIREHQWIEMIDIIYIYIHT